MLTCPVTLVGLYTDMCASVYTPAHKLICHIPAPYTYVYTRLPILVQLHMYSAVPIALRIYIYIYTWISIISISICMYVCKYACFIRWKHIPTEWFIDSVGCVLAQKWNLCWNLSLVCEIIVAFMSRKAGSTMCNYIRTSHMCHAEN